MRLISPGSLVAQAISSLDHHEVKCINDLHDIHLDHAS